MLTSGDIPDYVIDSKETVIFNCEKEKWFDRLESGLFRYDWYRVASKSRKVFNTAMDLRITAGMWDLGYRKVNGVWVAPDENTMTPWGSMCESVSEG